MLSVTLTWMLRKSYGGMGLVPLLLESNVEGRTKQAIPVNN